MAHCAHVFGPACAWSESAQPKQRSKCIASRLGNAIRAMKPAGRKDTSTEEKTRAVNADALIEVEECSLSKSKTLSDDDISTQSGSSRCSSSRSSKICLSEAVEESPSLPGAIEEISIPSKVSSPPESSNDLPKKSELDVFEARKSELDVMVAVIAESARAKFSGRVYQDVRNAFLAVDINGDGRLQLSEAIAFCQHFDLSSEFASRFFTLLDRHETGLANWNVFLATYASVLYKKSRNWHQLNGAGRKKYPAIQ